MSNTLHARIIHMHDVESVWNTIPEFIPKCGEVIVYDVDETHKSPRFKIGDGVTKIVDLQFGASDALNEIAVWDNNIGYIDAGKITSYTDL